MSESRPAQRERLAAALAEEEARLHRLDAERTEARARVEALRAQVAKLDEAPIDHAQAAERIAAGPRSPSEKVKLFRLLFRGRDDLYPTRFVSKKTGKPGYAPACANKFVEGVCELPKVKCGDCTNQAFRPVDDGAVLGHLRGKHVMGVYPMLPDETCSFLAVDFDKGTWKEDVRAFAETARRLGLPALIERSRSGNGAHVWFFFSEPVSSSSARKMGCHVITETMSSRHELSMDSYDRLFPSQDTMPRGGFGNLIALPLQHGPRQEGNSVFLDANLDAYPDAEQWSALASTRRISPEAVERIAAEAARTGSIVGVRLAEPVDDEEAAMPWTRPPSGKPRVKRLTGPLPASLGRARATVVRREGGPPFGPSEPDQAARGVPESGVL